MSGAAEVQLAEVQPFASEDDRRKLVRAYLDQYLKELDQFTRTIRHGCLGNAADFVELDTSTPLDVSLSTYLASRGKRR